MDGFYRVFLAVLSTYWLVRGSQLLWAARRETRSNAPRRQGTIGRVIEASGLLIAGTAGLSCFVWGPTLTALYIMIFGLLIPLGGAVAAGRRARRALGAATDEGPDTLP